MAPLFSRAGARRKNASAWARERERERKSNLWPLKAQSAIPAHPIVSVSICTYIEGERAIGRAAARNVYYGEFAARARPFVQWFRASIRYIYIPIPFSSAIPAVTEILITRSEVFESDVLYRPLRSLSFRWKMRNPDYARENVNLPESWDLLSNEYISIYTHALCAACLVYTHHSNGVTKNRYSSDKSKL